MALSTGAKIAIAGGGAVAVAAAAGYNPFAPDPRSVTDAPATTVEGIKALRKRIGIYAKSDAPKDQVVAPHVARVFREGTLTPELQKVRDMLKAEYDKLTGEAKCKGAEALKQQYPDVQLPPGDCASLPFDVIMGAVGAVAGAAGCSAVGLGGAAPLCAIAGTYLGKSIAPYIEKAWDDVKDAAEGAWDWLSDKV